MDQSQEEIITSSDSKTALATSNGRKGIAWLGRGFDGFLAGLAVLGLVTSLGSTLFQIIARYVFSNPVTWSEELSRFAFIWLTFLAAAVAIRKGEMMVSVDSLIGLAPQWAQKAAKLLSSSLVALVAIILVVFGWQVCEGLTSRSLAMGWPVKLFYAAPFVGGIFILINLVRAPADRHARIGEMAIIVGASILFWVLFIADWVPPPDWNMAIVVIGVVVFVICVGVPVAYSIAFGAVLGYWLDGSIPLTALPHQWVNGVDSFLLLAIPFFLLAGQFMNEGGITRRLVALASVLVGHLIGGLAHVNILCNFFMGGLSGSSAGDCAALTKVLVPEMAKRGYGLAFSAAVTSAASILANLIPPSIMFMVYGAVAAVSIGRLFLAGILPGVVLTLAYMVAVHIISVRRGYKGMESRARAGEVVKEAKSALWALPMPLIILGGIRFGVTTPTEAAGIATVYALLVGAFIYRELKPSRIPRLVLNACLETCMIMMILGASQPFSWVLTAQQIPQLVAQFFISISDNPIVILLMLNFFLLLVGLPLEAAPGVIILVPILMPVLQSIGMDPVQFGVVIVTNLLLGSLTPPVGVLVFISAGIAKVPAGRVFRESFPLLLAGIGALMLMTYWPQLSLWLPNLLMGVAK
jgi:tripartite ATP-independent transporter DctM subunit